MTAATNNCLAVPASTNYLTGTTISFLPSVSPTSQTQASSILTWTNVSPTIYTAFAQPPNPKTTGVFCLSNNGGPWSQYASGTLTSGGTLDFAIGSGKGETRVSSKNWLVNDTASG
jgi:hypothetical protein